MTRKYRYVFQGRNDPKKLMIEASINQVIKHIGYKDRFIGHGFRYMISMILHEKGFQSAFIEIQLAHVDKNNIRGTYNYAIYLTGRQKMMQRYNNYLCEIKGV